MTPSLIAGCLWVVGAALTALLPMRSQYLPGTALLIVAPFLIGWIFWLHGAVVGLAALAALLSTFGNPLIYLARKALGVPVAVPHEVNRDGAP